MVGGRTITGTNALGAAIGAGEAKPTNMDSTLIQLCPNRRYLVHCRFKASGGTPGDQFVFYIKEDTATAGTTGNYIGERIVQASDANTKDFFTEYETGASAVIRAFKLTGARLSGAGTIQVQGAGTTPAGVWVYDMGRAGVATVTAS
jgi:hypothetical protein